jgi:hypothetical protein
MNDFLCETARALRPCEVKQEIGHTSLPRRPCNPHPSQSKGVLRMYTFEKYEKYIGIYLFCF